MRVTGLDLRPPSCLASVRTTRAIGEARQKLVEKFVSDEEDARSREWHDSLGRTEEWVSTRDESEVWLLGCPCGEDKGKVFGVRVDDQFSAPLFYACVACSFRTLIFDPALHGYNAEITKRKRKARKPPNATFAMHCRACKTTLWRPAVLVTYQGDIDEDHLPRIADHFDVILVGGTCVSCGEVDYRYDAECA